MTSRSQALGKSFFYGLQIGRSFCPECLVRTAETFLLPLGKNYGSTIVELLAIKGFQEGGGELFATLASDGGSLDTRPVS